MTDPTRAPLARYGFRDAEGHPLETCAEYQAMLSAIEAAHRYVTFPDSVARQQLKAALAALRGEQAQAGNPWVERAGEPATGQGEAPSTGLPPSEGEARTEPTSCVGCTWHRDRIGCGNPHIVGYPPFPECYRRQGSKE